MQRLDETHDFHNDDVVPHLLQSVWNEVLSKGYFFSLSLLKGKQNGELYEGLKKLNENLKGIKSTIWPNANLAPTHSMTKFNLLWSHGCRGSVK